MSSNFDLKTIDQILALPDSGEFLMEVHEKHEALIEQMTKHVDETNLRALRSPCHKVKTKQDVAQKSTEARKRAKHLGLHETRQPLPGNRKSKFKRKIGGRVVRRDQE